MTHHLLRDRTLQLVEFQTFVIVRNRNTEEYESITFSLEVGEINMRVQTASVYQAFSSPNFRMPGYKAMVHTTIEGIPYP